MKIGFRITALMIVISTVSVGVLCTVLILWAGNTSTNLTRERTQSVARQVSREFENFLQINWQKTAALAAVMGQFESLPISGRRPFINNVLKKILEQNEYILTSFAIWDTNALEGNDAVWIGSVGSNENGRFMPGHIRTLSGEIASVAAYDFDGADFFELPRKLNRQIITNPYQMELEGEMHLMAAISAPIYNRENKLVGVVGLDIDLKYLSSLGQNIGRLLEDQSSKVISTAFSNDGTIISHMDKSRLGRNLMETEGAMLGNHIEAFARAIAYGKEYNLDINVDDESLWFCLVPTIVGDYPEAWAFAVAISADDIHREARGMVIFAIILCAITLLIIVFATMMLSRSITGPITSMATTLKNIATGEGDLTVRLPDTRQDEIGEASRYFNQTMEKIRELVIAIKNKSGELSHIGDQLARNMGDTASAMNEIASTIQSIKGRVINQSASVSETNATMEQVTVNINKLDEFVHRQTGAVSQASSSIEQMLANIQSVTTTLSRNSKRMLELQESSESGRSSLEEVSSDIQKISQESEGLLEINTVMENIASQTNLLSMNAAIEAAHAGEAGKGFAVVADEIRKLAESSSAQSKTIGQVLRKIKDSIDKISRSTDSVIKNFEVIDHGVQAVAREGEEIRGAMEEQDEGSRQVLHASEQVSEITQQVQDGSQQMLEGSKEVIHESKNLELVTQEITSGINEMATGAEHVNEAINSVNNLSGKNRENISALVQAVSQFKV